MRLYLILTFALFFIGILVGNRQVMAGWKHTETTSGTREARCDSVDFKVSLKNLLKRYKKQGSLTSSEFKAARVSIRKDENFTDVISDILVKNDLPPMPACDGADVTRAEFTSAYETTGEISSAETHECDGLVLHDICYFYLADFSNYNEATALCDRAEATLAVITDEDQFDSIQTYLRSLRGFVLTVWLGGSYNQNTSNAEWVDGTTGPVNSKFWYPKYPYTLQHSPYYFTWDKIGAYVTDNPKSKQGLFNVPKERTYSPLCQYPLTPDKGQ